MLPVIRIGFLQLPAYGVMVFLGAVCYVLFLLFSLTRFEKKSPDVVKKTLLVSALSFVCLVLGAAFFNALFHSIAAGRLVIGGITWEGGVIVGFAAFLLFTRVLVKSERGNEAAHFSHVLPGLILAHGLGRVGCFLGGCCFGAITESPLGVVFPTGSPAALAYPNTLTGQGSFPVLPTQLFEAVFEVLLFALLVIFYRRLRNYNLVIYLVAYGVFRFVLEFFRGDDRGGTGSFLTPSQLMSLVLLVFGVLLLLVQRGVIFKKLTKRAHTGKENAMCDTQ